MPGFSRIASALPMLACWLAASSWTGRSVAAEPPGRPIVPGFERFHSDPVAGDSTGGRLLLGELNCTACHKGDDAPLAPVARRQAPILDRAGARVKVDHLRAFLSDPHAVKPGTTMPDLLAGRPKDDVDALVHFLASTGSTTDTAVNRKAIGQGKTLFEQVGCLACHANPASKSSPLPTSVPMADLAGKYSYNSLTAFLLDPLSARPSGRMPALNLKPAEAQAVASYLLKELRVETPPSLAYRYYEGEWAELPDFDKLTPVASGLAEGFDVNAAKRHSNYALRFEGTLEVDRAGPYTFHLASDDGSKIAVDG